jgi:hypothetical protein
VGLFTGCGDSYDQVATDMVNNLQQVRDTLKTVTDKSTAESAAAKIMNLGTKMQAIQTRFSELGKPTKDVGDGLNAKYSKTLTELHDDIAEQRERITKVGPEVAGIVDDAMHTAMKSPNGLATRPL